MRDYNVPRAILEQAKHAGQIVRLREHYKALSTRKIRLIQDTTRKIQQKTTDEKRSLYLQDIEQLLAEEMLRRV